MISRILRQAQDEENHKANTENVDCGNGFMLSLSKHAAVLSPISPQGKW
jgi:hypothetical protein